MKEHVFSHSPILKAFLVLVCLCFGLNFFYYYITDTNIAFALFVPVRRLVEGIYQKQIFKPSGNISSVSLDPTTLQENVRESEPYLIKEESLFKILPTTPLTKGNVDPQQENKPSGDSSLVPLRGPGDSYLPFQDESVPQFDTFSKDLLTEKPKGVDPLDPDNPPLKKILFWNEGYDGGGLHFRFGFGREPFFRAGCPVNTCMTTGDRSRFPLEDVDAVVWHFRSSDRSLPPKRSPHTRYIFWMRESASYRMRTTNIYDNVFNWTFTYRLDSDFPTPYGVTYRRRDPLPVPINQNITAGKTKLAAWFASNCKTIGGRIKLVNTLKKWIKIDIYGKCGTLTCERRHQYSCLKMLERDYKFYFSFENSLCKDYVTEKFFKILPLYVVPVVYGLGNYSLQAPPHSYINALDFSSAKVLAQYLLYLDKNDTAYNEYFQWKPYHHFPRKWDNLAKPWCDVCERLHTDNTNKVYDLSQWFVRGSHCLNSLTPKISNLING